MDEIYTDGTDLSKSTKLPINNESFHLFPIFKKIEDKSRILVFLLIEFRNSNTIFEFLFPF